MTFAHFLYFRLGQILNLYWEKLPQNILYDVVQSSLNDIGQQLEEYTSCEDCLLRDFIGVFTYLII